MDLFSPISKQGPSMFLQEHVTDWDQWYVLYVINTDSEVLSGSISYDSLGLDTSEMGVYDFWDQKYLGKQKERVCVHVEPYSTKVLRLFKHKTYPTVISTDMHVSQGAVDLKCIKWDEENCMLSGCAVRGVGETGSLIVSLPNGYLPASYMNNNVARSDLHDETVIYKQIRFHRAQETFEIRFKKEKRKTSKDSVAGRMKIYGGASK
ncbi:MAG TPA: hypothetical protein DDZ89_15690 [Clostridiales bacterium]|nr:hypothetical protein [Clostridiales bacterium]